MPEPTPQWQLPASSSPPADWLDTVCFKALEPLCPAAPSALRSYIAQLLWQRGIRQPKQLRSFLSPEAYCPTSPFAFGPEMDWAIARLKQACGQAKDGPTDLEKVAIWGDFDADGVTATAVLWEGLRPLFAQTQTTSAAAPEPTPDERLRFYIPNRFTESHGLSRTGLEQLSAWGCQLLITCDTGSTSLAELDYAQQLGMAVIVTDHHTLPEQRPPVVALINPRSLPPEHPLRSLSGVAVAYKLLEALYQSLPQPPLDLTELLDLVAIGLIADLVELTGDCRYLAQRGLVQLQRQLQQEQPSRPGVARLLELCRRTGDRPSDISFGIGPRINAISRIHGDARFCVELLTSRDPHRCQTLALEAELANTRRKALQRDLLGQIKARITELDLATTEVIVLAGEQWSPGILGLVAGQIAQEYGRPVILLSYDPAPADAPAAPVLLRGSARSRPGLDLYALFKAQAHLLTSYGGHPLAAGLSLPAENLPLLAAALNRQVREQRGQAYNGPTLAIDLTVTVDQLGQDLFRLLKLLEPYGMGNPVPRLLIKDAWTSDAWHQRLKDQRGGKVAFIRTEFKLWDATVQNGFTAEWWDHLADDLPAGRCDVVIELDFSPRHRYIARLVAIRPTALSQPSVAAAAILDWRHQRPLTRPEALVLTTCPSSWSEWAAWMRQAAVTGQPLAIAYPPPSERPAAELWRQLVGLAKYLARTQQTVSLAQLQARLQLSLPALRLGLKSLESVGLMAQPISSETGLSEATSQAQIVVSHVVSQALPPSTQATAADIAAFLAAVQEEQFCQRYFYQAPVTALTAMDSAAITP